MSRGMRVVAAFQRSISWPKGRKEVKLKSKVRLREATFIHYFLSKPVRSLGILSRDAEEVE